MAKSKNKKAVTSDRVNAKKEPKKLNPFEVHINKEKLRVIGKKQKNDRGLPGISRAKAIKKRKSTLLEEYKVLNKSNKFVDKRIGEKVNMDSEDKAMARFTALKIKSHNKKSIFNLADDEVLTHKGQTLSEIEKFDDPRSDDDFSDDENKSGNLDTNFVEEAHFGGGILRNTGKEGAMTHKDLINQLIVESKKRKAEKQKTKEATLELTEKLDSEWKDLIPLVTNSKKTEEDSSKSKVDDYDKIMRELKFEKRGTVSDRLKTEEEIAKEEKESLEKLEQERMLRMNKDMSEEVPQRKHRSADDLDDGFVYDEEVIEENVLSYNDKGESNVPVEAFVNGNSIKANGEVSEDEEQNENSEKASSDEELETDSEDNLSDLKEAESESENECNEEIVDKEEVKQNLSENEVEKKFEIIKSPIEFEKEVAEIPFTFNFPESYENLQNLLNEYKNNEHVVIERMIKCYHPSLSDQNKEKLGLLFAYLLQYLNDLFADEPKEEELKKHFKIFQYLVPQIYSLAQLNKENAHNSMLEVIKEKFDEYKKRPKTYPGLEVLIFFKLVSVLFSTSDFRHQVVTPCYIFLELLLTRCRVKSKRDICYGLFISTLVLEYSVLSKRYLPAVINYLAGLLHMAIPKTSVKLLKIAPPFKSISTLLVLLDNYSLECLNNLKLKSVDFYGEEITSEFQVRVLYNVIQMLFQFLEQYKTLPSYIEIFEKVSFYLQLIPINNYPREVRDFYKIFSEKFNKYKEERQLEYLVLETSKPKALRLYEPKIEVVYDGKQHKSQSKEKAHINKLLHKIKREKKGALREIRKDNAFLGRVKISKQLESDKERREKVKRIYSEAAMQQSELNALDRTKKRKK